MVSRTFKACDENMQAVNDFIHSNFPENISPKAAGEIDLAVEEIFVNIAHYAYHPETGTVEIECSVDEEGFLKIVFYDSGMPYNPLLRKDPDITQSAEERNIGGLGIFLTKKFMDDVGYFFAGGKNVLYIRKRL
ncbi:MULTISPECIES: ATP-binding protein [Treponema]|uniref:ATP-binding protein n=1 Tax=Treponema rectale TaxID=744512 RepID=A0A840SBN2_9SPIR|nr:MULTISPECIES: ATP-binding protein [Treponema]MBB5218195.1 anti-sigma regulatory factor (Ser/Thr protein kinase) [Treponema rectale]MBE6354425.1 ATP-binding protein [Treponema sp.]MBO6177412.1 ATP-binding protein [Treponema sp.]QOS40100.1 ATP-binding protein [Treponema rectale]